MQALEFISELTEKGEVRVPNELAGRIPLSLKFRVILLLPDEKSANPEADWSRLTAEQFLAGYADSDSIYDKD